MASVFGHSFSAIVFTKLFKKKDHKPDLLLYSLSIACAVMPDLDVIGFDFGIRYSSPLGHRGLTHSILFAFFWGYLMSRLYLLFKSTHSYKNFILFLFFSLCTLSHGLLDALTNGGKGVGFFIPLENSRYFFPLNPILVSPLGIDDFFSHRGLRVLYSEFIWIGIPGMALMLLNLVLHKVKRKQSKG